jgi:leader peptidase (prepilin peptidase) / N-methyltransferase
LQYYLAVVSLILGLVVGSFLNVVIYRLPLRQSLVRPSSHCPSCGKPVRWHDNVPVFGWIVLRGRCRDCRLPISVRYPAIEALTGVLFLLCFVRFGVDWPILVGFGFVACMVAIAFIDYDHMIIPNKIVLPGTVIGLAASIAINPHDWWKYVAASAGSAFFLFLLAMIWAGGMGPGDIKLAAFMGAVLGTTVIVALFASFFLGAIAGVFLIATRKRTRKDKIPFGPYLAAGSVIALLVGQMLVHSYVGLYAHALNVA